MKNTILGLVFALFAFQANAATLSLYGTQADAENAVNVISTGANVSDGVFLVNSDTSTSFTRFLTVDPDATTLSLGGGSPNLNITLTELSIESVFGSDIGGSWITNILQASGDITLSTALLAGSVYEITLSFIKDAGVGASVDINVSQVPVPAAVWLFGSALMGLAGFTRRKPVAA